MTRPEDGVHVDMPHEDEVHRVTLQDDDRDGTGHPTVTETAVIDDTTGELVTERPVDKEELDADEFLRRYTDLVNSDSFVLFETLRKYVDSDAVRIDRSDPDGQDLAMPLIKALLRRLPGDFYEKHLCVCRYHVEPDSAAQHADHHPQSPAQHGPGSEIPADAVRAIASVEVPQPFTGGTSSGAASGGAVSTRRSGLPEDPTDPDGRGAALRPRMAELLDSGPARRYLGRLNLEGNAEERWRQIHVAMLRLPRLVREDWFDRLGSMRTMSSDLRRVHTIDGESVVVIPGWPGGMSPTLHTERLTHLPSVLEPLPLAVKPPGMFWRFADLVAQVLELSTWDTELHEAVTDPSRFRPLDTLERVEEYRKILIRKFKELAQASNPEQQLNRAVTLDEALRSLIHRPFSAGDSWWGILRSTSHRVVDEYARWSAEAHKLDAQVKLIDGGLFKDAVEERLVQERGNIRMPGSAELHGTIAACLRLHLRVKNKSVPAKVIYYGS
jgi:hypothetical protein